MDKPIIQLPADLTKITTMRDKTLRMQFDSARELTGEESAIVMGYSQDQVWLCIKTVEFQDEDMLDLPKLPKPPKEDGQKSKSERLRSALYVYFEKRGKKDLYNAPVDFDSFYNQLMEKFIDHVKTKIEELQ